MKVKELSVAANISWSPDYLSSTLLACGTSTQQLDASFNSSSVLQLYDLNQKNSTLDMKLMATANVAAKFNKVLWNGKQCGGTSHPSGIIAGGCDNGSIYLYSPDKMLRKEEPLVSAMEGKHAGAVFSLDFNHHQPNLLASGSKDCEIIIWDINDTSSPMTPGAKPTLTSDVTAVAWNRKVEHIMASTYAGRCVVYDLRKSTSIAQIAESVSRIKAQTVRWHPSVATQLILCSDDDATPFGQVWDLRFVAAPLKSLEGHQRGIVTSSWCLSDSDLFITSGKDNKMLVWNPNNNGKVAEIVGEFPSYNQWSFDLAWCNKDPSLVAAASIDGTVSVYSILGAGIPPAQSNKFSAIADSFPGMEMPIEVPQTVQPQPIYLKRPPQWFPKRSGASFGFGGRLLSWNSTATTITISQIVTEPEFVSRSTQLEEALSKPNLNVYCQSKAQDANDSHEKTLWNFIGATFEPSVRKSYMALLGFTPEQVAAKVRPEDLTISPEELAEKIANLGPNAQEGSTSSLDPSEQFEMIASAHSLDKTPDAEVESNGEIASTEPLSLSVGEDSHGLIRHALLIGDYESAVQLCLKEKKHSYALILAAHAGVEIFNKTRDSILRTEAQNGLSALITSVVQRDLYCLVSKCKLSDWRESLVAVLTYASDDELGPLLQTLGERLESGNSSDKLQSAVLCFLCAGNLDKFISCLSKSKQSFSSGSPSSLQNLIEIMVVLERALSSLGRSVNLRDGNLSSSYLCKYAALLASQGALSTAVSYLNNPTESEMVDLRDRLYRALGYQTGSSLAASRTRTLSSSSQPPYRRSSTPLSYQPPQFTPSVQAQQASYATGGLSAAPPPVSTSFYNPAHIAPKQPPSFMQPTAVVPPSFGGGALQPSLTSQFQPFQPSPTMKPIAPAPQMGPPPLGSTPAGFRRPNASNRYFPEQPLTPGVAVTPPFSSGGGVFTPSPNAHRQGGQPNTNFSPFNPSAVPPTAPPPTASLIPPAGALGGNVPSPVVEEASEAFGNPVTPAAFDPSVPRGWNDPPPLSASRRTKQRQKGVGGDPNAVPPIHGVMVPEPVEQPQHFQGFPQSFQGPPQNVGTPNLPSASVAPHSQVAPPPPPKGPLPPEHQVIQEVFNRLREKGILATNNPAAKQRLEDLSMKLEILYDKLREGKIGANTIGGLHEIVSAVKGGDYHRALQLHAATIGSGTFSEMSQFMPAVKMLLTTCMQCQVFYN